MGPAEVIDDMQRATRDGFTLTLEYHQDSLYQFAYLTKVILGEPDVVFAARGRTAKTAIVKALQKWADA